MEPSMDQVSWEEVGQLVEQKEQVMEVLVQKVQALENKMKKLEGGGDADVEMEDGEQTGGLQSLDVLKFMEGRLDNAHGFIADICRHTAVTMRTYKPEAGGLLWVERRLRVMVEVWCRQLQGMPLEKQKMLWRMLCTEVKLRQIRDVVLVMLGASSADDESLEKMEKTKKSLEKNKKMLKNFYLKGLKYWTPMAYAEWNGLEPDCWQMWLLKDQLEERAAELKEMETSAEARQIKIMDGLEIPDWRAA